MEIYKIIFSTKKKHPVNDADFLKINSLLRRTPVALFSLINRNSVYSYSTTPDSKISTLAFTFIGIEV